MTKKTYPRTHETRYWMDNREKKPMSRGYPKAEEGSIDGAAKAVAKGFASKVQRINRDTGNVEWTVLRGPKLPGKPLYGFIPFKGDPDERKR